MKHCRHGLMIALLLLAVASVQAMAAALADNVPGAGPFEGYTLVAPMRSHTTYLIDLEGRCVHKWESDYPPGLGAYLLENGHLLRTARRESTPEDQAASGAEAFQGAFQGGRVQEFTWDGELVWDFEYASDRYMRHHDVTPMPNGHVLLIAWELKTAEEAIAAGRDPQKLGAGELWPDQIVEIQPEGPTGGRVVWEWHVWDHLVQDFDAAKTNYGVVGDHPELVDINWVDTTPKGLHARPAVDNAEEREKLAALGYMPAAPAKATAAEGRASFDHFQAADFNHTNSVAYNAALDQIALSVLKFNEVWIIDHGTTTVEAAGHAGGRCGRGGDLLYRWGNPQAYRAGAAADQKFFGQHDARWVEPGRPGAGNLLVFNNGVGRADGDYSTVEEITPPLTNAGGYARTPGRPFGPAEVAWRYEAPEKTRFFSKIISGAQRQPNGNTLICEGTRGRLFEVTPAGEIVWQYQHKADCDQGCQKGIFKVRRYTPDFPGVAGHELTPEPMPDGSTALPAEPVIPTAPTPEQLARALNPPSGEKDGCPVIHVNKAATGNGDGLSWANACTTITRGMAAAATCGSDVWIARGTYVESITLVSGVALYGGFTGMETALDQRDITANVTVLDGYGHPHAVVMSGVVNTRLDGLTVTRGGQNVPNDGRADGGGIYCANADSTNVVISCEIVKNQANSFVGECLECYYYPSRYECRYVPCERRHCGGGIYCNNALPVISACTIKGNTASDSGGGVYGGAVQNCTFNGNTAGYGGGMCYGTASNCTFTGNITNRGGGIYQGNASNCIFTGNRGGGMYEGTATNCTFTLNTAVLVGGGIWGGTAVNCILWLNGNDVTSYTIVTNSCLSVATPGVGNIAGNPLFVNAAAGDFRLRPASPCINTGTTNGAPATDILGVSRPQGAGVDMGAYEYVPGPAEGETEGEGEPQLEGEAEGENEGEHETQVAVPEMLGLSQTMAISALTAVQLTIGATTLEYSASAPFGTVISQTPGAGTLVAAGAAIDLVISLGAAPVMVVTPNVIGQTISAANTAINAAGLNTGETNRQHSATVPAGQVISQDPAAGAEIVTGSFVNFVVSLGPAPTFVNTPNVVHQSRASASNAIISAGLIVGIVSSQYSATVAEGQIVSQEPKAGAKVAAGASVNLVISRGPAPQKVTVPDVVGQTRDQAEAAVTGAGLSLGAVTEVYSSAVPTGHVLIQDPAAGRQVDAGTAVAIMVSRGPQPVAVPDVSAMPLDQAQAAIANAGFTGTISEESNATLAAGQIIRQEPPAGTPLPPGASVVLVVSSGPEDKGLNCLGCPKQKGAFSIEDLKKSLGDLFLAGLSLTLLLAAARRRV